MLHISLVFSSTVEKGYQIIPVKMDQLGKLIFSGGMNSTDLLSIYICIYICVYTYTCVCTHTTPPTQYFLTQALISPGDTQKEVRFTQNAKLSQHLEKKIAFQKKDSTILYCQTVL